MGASNVVLFLVAAVCAVIVIVLTIAVGGISRKDWLTMEGRFQSFTDKMPKAVPGVPWHGENPHPRADPHSGPWILRGGHQTHRAELDGLCRDAGAMLLR